MSISCNGNIVKGKVITVVSVGIDVSKGQSKVSVLDEYGEIIQKPKDFNHTKTGLTNLVDEIKELENNNEVRVIMEATGVYHLPILSFLKERDIFVCVVNPLVMKKYIVQNLRKAKTDKIDSLRIATYGIDHWYRLVDFEPISESYEELRLLGRQYASFIEIKIDCKQNLSFLLERAMPGITKLIRSGHSNRDDSDKLSDFTKKFWHYDKITQCKEDVFIEKYCKWAKEKGYHQSQAKAKQIYELAVDSIPTISSNPSTKMLVLETVEALKKINSTLFTILTRMQEISRELPEYSVLIEFDGIGEVLAPRLIAEIGDVRRFKNSSSLIAYAGLDAPPYESGKFSATTRHISKRGSRLLRKTGYEAMQCISRVRSENSEIYRYIIKKENEGKPKKVAKIAGLNKFLRIYYARVRDAYQSLELKECS